MKPSRTSLLGAAALLLTGTLATAQILRLDLNQIVAQTDDAIYGTIIAHEVFKVDHPIDGNDLFYTTLYVEAETLTGARDKKQRNVAVTYPGGFIDDERGVFNSEAPTADEVQVGNEVVLFYKWTDNMGGDVAANALYGSHGGLYTTFVTPKGRRIVQGRGNGYAIESNIALNDLATRVDGIRKAQEQAK